MSTVRVDVEAQESGAYEPGVQESKGREVRGRQPEALKRTERYHYFREVQRKIKR